MNGGLEDASCVDIIKFHSALQRLQEEISRSRENRQIIGEDPRAGRWSDKARPGFGMLMNMDPVWKIIGVIRYETKRRD